MTEHYILPRGLESWSELPTAVLRAELARRATEDNERPACGGAQKGRYDTTIHVGALILILVLSVACT